MMIKVRMVSLLETFDQPYQLDIRSIIQGAFNKYLAEKVRKEMWDILWGEG